MTIEDGEHNFAEFEATKRLIGTKDTAAIVADCFPNNVPLLTIALVST